MRTLIPLVFASTMLASSACADWREMSIEQLTDVLAYPGSGSDTFGPPLLADESVHYFGVPGANRLSSVRFGSWGMGDLVWALSRPVWEAPDGSPDPTAAAVRIGRLVDDLGLPLPEGGFVGCRQEERWSGYGFHLEASPYGRGPRDLLYADESWHLTLTVDAVGRRVSSGDLRCHPAWEGPPTEAAVSGLLKALGQVLGRAPHQILPVGPLTWMSVRSRAGERRESWSLLAVPSDWRQGSRSEVALAGAYVGPDGALQGDAATMPIERAALARLFAASDPNLERRLAACIKPDPPFRDAHPAWQGEGVLYALSSRSRVGAPSWRRRVGAMRVDLADGAMAFLHPAWENDLGGVAVTESSLLTRLADRRDCRAIDLSAGEWWEPRVHGAVDYRHATFTRDGQRVTFEKDGFGQDIRVQTYGIPRGEVVARPEEYHAAGLLLKGDDIHPVFSPDETRVLFAHQDPKPEDETAPVPPWVLGSIPSDCSHRNTEWERLFELPAKPERLSAFPDGRILMWSESGLWLLDPEAKTAEPYGLPELRDPERPDQGPLTLREPAVSPSGARIAFSGSSDGQQWLLYVMNADGSDLRRVTPLEEQPVDYWTYPESGVSAFEIEKEWWIARAEVAQQAELERLRAVRDQEEGRKP